MSALGDAPHGSLGAPGVVADDVAWPLRHPVAASLAGIVAIMTVPAASRSYRTAWP
ncbi:hypothetical protein [Nocardia brevicatena]|uniref:hypothetical protein n=1 Tax=Nocardia brevicatena TaxID=37327 RepID=UPI0012FC0D62|nr:hypothetical protein [Nocardia brevicatena]